VARKIRRSTGPSIPNRIHFSVECRALVRFAILRSLGTFPRKIESRRRRTTRTTGRFAIAGGTIRPSGMEMQSRSRYVWISSKEPPAGSDSVYASRFHIGGAPWCAPANWVVAMRRAAPRRPVAHVGSRFSLASLPRIWRSLPHPSAVIFPVPSFDTKDSDLADRMTFLRILITSLHPKADGR